ncbi:hypothetical protein PTKIN_Ptkin19aG0087300 [Pterospermum kingtungense]
MQTVSNLADEEADINFCRIRTIVNELQLSQNKLVATMVGPKKKMPGFSLIFVMGGAYRGNPVLSENQGLASAGHLSKLRLQIIQFAENHMAASSSSSSSSSFSVSKDDFNLFHRIDRELYSLLVMMLWRDPVESMQVLALWLWLERVGFRKVVKKTLTLPHILINELADEAVTCLKVINNDLIASSSEGSDTPLMQCLMEKDLTLQFFSKHRLIATKGLARIMNGVCMKALKDIRQHAVERNAARSVAESHSQQVMPQPLQMQPMVQPGLPPMMGSGHVVGLPLPWPQHNEVHPDDRTMFVTFSKGYPVYEWEVREFFTRAYGDCIESLHMQEVMPYEQSLFARIVFHSPAAIEMILNGTSKAKFTINGKHVWARKFVSKRPRPDLMPPAPPLPPPPPPALLPPALLPPAPAGPPLEFPITFGSFHSFLPYVGRVVQSPFSQF